MHNISFSFLKYYLLFIILSLLSIYLSCVKSQAPRLSSYTDSEFSCITCITHDSSDNLYIAGFYQNIGTTNINIGKLNGFLEKIDNSGSSSWIINIGSDINTNGSIECVDVKFNDFDSLYLAGNFTDSVYFDMNDVKNSQVISEFTNDIFLAKYSLTGKLQWVRSFGSEIMDKMLAMYIDSNGDIYLVCGLGEIVDFDPSNEEIIRESSGSNLIKFTPSGELSSFITWNGVATDVAVNSQSEIIVCGGFTENLGINCNSTNETEYIGNSQSAYLIIFDSLGFCSRSVIWDVLDTTIAHSLELGNNEEIYVLGNTANLDLEETNSNIAINRQKNNCPFIYCYNLEMNSIREFRLDESINATGNSIDIDDEGNVFMVGAYRSNPNNLIANELIEDYGHGECVSNNGFILKLDSSNSIIWMHTFNYNLGHTEYLDAEIDESGKIHVVGQDYGKFSYRVLLADGREYR